MDDLFPDTLQPGEVGIAGLPAFIPRFFALYPDAGELPEIVERQLTLCREVAPSGSITARPARMLHVSIALCGTPRRLRYSMEEALRRAQEAFHFPAFDVVLDSTACFGSDGTALVAVADTHTTDRVHDLRRELADAQQRFGLIGERSATVPHLTLGYGKRLLDRRQAIRPLGFRAREVCLVISTGHSEHRCVARWPLGAGR
ncbi:MAG TPA: 2'-5' RNA ligase family protein [Rhodanobacteraceae bacterium]|nr:2'-5' RNA ligase family protein [Rhodanobacteraceae bacterium]